MHTFEAYRRNQLLRISVLHHLWCHFWLHLFTQRDPITSQQINHVSLLVFKGNKKGQNTNQPIAIPGMGQQKDPRNKTDYKLPNWALFHFRIGNSGIHFPRSKCRTTHRNASWRALIFRRILYIFFTITLLSVFQVVSKQLFFHSWSVCFAINNISSESHSNYQNWFLYYLQPDPQH